MPRLLTFIGLLVGLCLSVEAQDDELADLLQNRDYYVEATVSNSAPYVGEVITYTMRYYAISPPPYRYEFPDFSDFWIVSVPYSNTIGSIPPLQTIGDKQFYVGDLIAEIAPVTAGNVQIQPGQFGIDGSVFLDEVSLMTEPVTLNVQAIPSDAVPPGFNGAVGQYGANRTFSPVEITLGEPVTLQVSVEGLGNFDLLPSPQLPEAPDWQIYRQPARYQSAEASGLRFGQKIFEWLLIPQSTGTQTFPAFDFVYFDPTVADYRIIDFAEQQISVFPNADTEQRLRYIPGTSAQVEVPPLVAVRLPATDSTDDGDPLLWLLWGVPPVILLGSVVYRVGVSALQRRDRRRRYRTALNQLAEKLKTAQQMTSEDASYIFEQAIYQYIRDKSDNRQVATLTQAVTMLETQGIDPATVVATLNEAIELRYTPTSMSPDVARVGQRIYRRLKEIDRQWPAID